MANVVLQSQDLTNTARVIDECADELKASIDKLDGIMSDLKSVWNDRNAETYLTRYQELKREFPAFEQNVRNYGTFLNGVVEAYRREFMDEVASSVNSSNG